MNTVNQATTPVEVLERALEILSVEKAWIKHSMSLDGLGKTVQPYEPAAKCFCIKGAIERAARGPLEPDQILKHYGNEHAIYAMCAAEIYVSNKIYDRFGFYSIPEFNDEDSTTHSDVIKLMSQALADARAAAV